MNNLLRRMANGDASAFTEFATHYERKIVDYFWVRIRCYHTAEDVRAERPVTRHGYLTRTKVRGVYMYRITELGRAMLGEYDAS